MGSSLWHGSFPLALGYLRDERAEEQIVSRAQVHPSSKGQVVDSIGDLPPNYWAIPYSYGEKAIQVIILSLT
jgi:hypothetical protein